ncbi:MAG: DUF1818 family protein [Oscillatoriales cyanobacterium]|nr:MAG: DUF1818 family protein [Oscillatoriales cyanobacterium]
MQQPTAPPERFIKRGQGWQLGWDAGAAEFCGLVGDDRWAFELTRSELDDFCRLVQQLAETLQAIATELMEDERIACEAESETLWIEAEGFPDRYTLHVILQTGRRCEAFWDETAARELTVAARSVRVFSGLV